MDAPLYSPIYYRCWPNFIAYARAIEATWGQRYVSVCYLLESRFFFLQNQSNYISMIDQRAEHLSCDNTVNTTTAARVSLSRRAW